MTAHGTSRLSVSTSTRAVADPVLVVQLAYRLHFPVFIGGFTDQEEGGSAELTKTLPADLRRFLAEHDARIPRSWVVTWTHPQRLRAHRLQARQQRRPPGQGLRSLPLRDRP